jgi:hypothetical protein
MLEQIISLGMGLMAIKTYSVIVRSIRSNICVVVEGETGPKLACGGSIKHSASTQAKSFDIRTTPPDCFDDL